jgi:NAD(P)-dependent dehydrogenase (short-subunit alcohol dehydrogenase family)
MKVLVTGGAKRLGKILCTHFAKAGADVAVHYHTSKEQAEALVDTLRTAHPTGRFETICANLADSTETDALVTNAGHVLKGELTALINNASVFDYDTPASFTAALLTNAMAVNVAAPMILSRRFFEQAGQQANNVIIDLLDQKLENLNPDFFSYTLSKAALKSAIEMRAVAFAPKVRVCGIAPGLLFPSYDQTEAEYRSSSSRNLNGFAIDPEQVGIAALSLAINACFNGQVLYVDNGQHLLKDARDVMFTDRQAATKKNESA